MAFWPSRWHKKKVLFQWLRILLFKPASSVSCADLFHESLNCCLTGTFVEWVEAVQQFWSPWISRGSMLRCYYNRDTNCSAKNLGLPESKISAVSCLFSVPLDKPEQLHWVSRITFLCLDRLSLLFLCWRSPKRTAQKSLILFFPAKHVERFYWISICLFS